MLEQDKMINSQKSSIIEFCGHIVCNIAATVAAEL
jgi:hypothetical protein